MILLSFDIEEFDMPFEYGKSISFEEQISISVAGTKKILTLLKQYQVKATFFTTVIFAQNAKELIKDIIADGHEIASHGFYHSQFSKADYLLSKIELEKISEQNVIGFRMPRMQPVDDIALHEAGYVYNSSINPTYIPGRYNNLNISRTFFMKDNILQMPASVSPSLRFPLFWLSFHNLPPFFYYYLCKQVLKKDKYLNIYFHPWEFMDISKKEKFNFPFYISKNTGDKMLRRMEALVLYLKKQTTTFITIKDFVKNIRK